MKPNIQTPAYCYDLDLLDATLEAVNACLTNRPFHVHYALKANTQKPILDRIIQYGMGADCVSGGEVECALESGFSPNQILFAGVGKTDRELHLAMDAGIAAIIIESFHELQVVEAMAKEKGLCMPIALRINPSVDAKTHAYITTGLNENKFGLNEMEWQDALQLCQNSKYVHFKGFHFHVGSQITDLSVFEQLCGKVNQFNALAQAKGLTIDWIDVGGGLGIDYEAPDTNPIPDFEAYFQVFEKHLNIEKGQEVHFELGRCLVGQCGQLLTKALYLKPAMDDKEFVVVDAGMTDLMRPALYQAEHRIVNRSAKDASEEKLYHVVGPICESSDQFGKNIAIAGIQRNDLLCIQSVGAYGEVLSSHYNLRKKAQSIFYRGKAPWEF